MKPSARLSYGQYKPVIVHPCGRTETVGTNAKWKQIQPQTQFYSGPSEVVTYKRGKVFQTRDEAVAYAQKCITARTEAVAKYRADYEQRAAREASNA